MTWAGDIIQPTSSAISMLKQYLHEQSSFIGRDGGYGGPNSIDFPLTKGYLVTLLLNGQSAGNKD